MTKKRIPAIIYNDDTYRYPKGLRINDQDELDIKLKSGEWNTGPVDAAKNPPKEKYLSQMTVEELVEAAGKRGIIVDENQTKKQLLEKIKAHDENEGKEK